MVIICEYTAKKKTRRSRTFSLHEIKNLQEGEEIHEAMESDSAFVEVKCLIRFNQNLINTTVSNRREYMEPYFSSYF